MDAGAGVEDSAASKRTFFRLTTDGRIVAARGQPEGEAAIGAVLRAPDESVAGTIGKRIGWQKDHHVAEYRALIEGLKLAQTHGIQHIRVFTDSALVVGQVNGDSSVKAEHLRPLCNEARELLTGFRDRKVCWIPREWNVEAHQLADEQLKVSVVEPRLADDWDGNPATSRS